MADTTFLPTIKHVVKTLVEAKAVNTVITEMSKDGNKANGIKVGAALTSAIISNTSLLALAEKTKVETPARNYIL